MRAYRALLRLYPSSFRGEYGEEMCAIFARRRRQASGALAIVALWAETVADVVLSAARTHLDIFRQDISYTARTLGRSPGFTLTAILVAALGIGATTAAFSVTDHVLIRALPFPDSDRLVKVWQDQSFRGYSRMELSPGNYRDWRRLSTTFEAMAAFHTVSLNLVGQGDPERLDGASVTADLFPMLGTAPVVGRVFTASDDREGAPGTLLLSYRLWKAQFGGDAGVLGRTVILDDEPYVVIGVMPQEFYFPTREAELWTTERFGAADFVDRTDCYLQAVAKLKRGVTLEQARAEMRVVAGRLERAFPKENAKTSANVYRLRDELSEQARLLVVALFGAALCVLLIACTNLANLLLARGLFRRKELAVRTALGAGRERLVRQLLTESVVLAVCGGLLGVGLALVATPLIARLVPNSLPIAEAPAIDLRVLMFAALVAGLTGIGFGVVPALRACGDADPNGLREGSRAGMGGRKERLRAGLVLAEVAISVVLLISSGLLIRALGRLRAIDPGFRTDGVVTLRTTLPLPKYERTERRVQFYDGVLSGVRQLPAVSDAAYISFLPMVMRGGIWSVTVAGHPENPAESRTASLRFVTPGFFAALGIPIRAGRDVSESDSGNAPFVAVVSQSFVRDYLPAGDPLGRHFRCAFQDRTVVGIVGDIRVRGLERSSEPQVYLPYQQVPDGGLPWYAPKDLIIRSAAEPALLVPAIRQIITKVDPQQPISDVRTLSDIVGAETAPRAIQVRVLTAFAAIAVLLACIGIHGLLAFTVSHQTQEIGVRIALGAQSRDIVAMVARRGVVLASAGVALGLTLAYAAGRAMEALLAGVSPADVTTFAAAVAVSLLMTLAGSLLPALRALRVDPLTAIRSE